MGLKVAMVSPFFVHCGIATYTENLSKALANLDCDVLGIRVPRFGPKSPEIFECVVDRIPLDKVDLIHVQHEYGIWQGHEPTFFTRLKTLGKPVVTTCHAVGNWSLDNVIAFASDKIIVHNTFCFRRFGHPSKTVIIPHGASPTECPPKEESRKAWDIRPLAVSLVGYVGFISSYKGLETLFEAMVKVPKTAVLIGGGWHVQRETEYIARLKQGSEKLLAERCRWLGYVADEKLPTLYGSLDVVVYPSRFATESGALIMALSHGKAVLASALPPFKEKEKLGALMTFKSVKDLTRKIKRLLKDEELRRKLEDGAKRYAKETSWDVVAQKHVELYKEVCG